MTIESITISISIQFSDSVGTREISIPLSCTNPTEDRPTFSSDFTSLSDFTRTQVIRLSIHHSSIILELKNYLP